MEERRVGFGHSMPVLHLPAEHQGERALCIDVFAHTLMSSSMSRALTGTITTSTDACMERMPRIEKRLSLPQGKCYATVLVMEDEFEVIKD